MARSSSRADEYELMPIKPLKDLRSEVKLLRSALTKPKKDTSAKEFTKILNTAQDTKKGVASLVKTMDRIRDRIDSLLDLFEAAEGGEEDRGEDYHKELLQKLTELGEQNKSIINELRDVTSALKRQTYFREHLPRGRQVIYRRTK